MKKIIIISSIIVLLTIPCHADFTIQINQKAFASFQDDITTTNRGGLKAFYEFDMGLRLWGSYDQNDIALNARNFVQCDLFGFGIGFARSRWYIDAGIYCPTWSIINDHTYQEALYYYNSKLMPVQNFRKFRKYEAEPHYGWGLNGGINFPVYKKLYFDLGAGFVSYEWELQGFDQKRNPAYHYSDKGFHDQNLKKEDFYIVIGIGVRF